MIWKTIAAKWHQRKLNRWLNYNRKGLPVDKALAKAGLPAEKALAILESSLYGRLSQVGIITFGNGRDSFTESREQLPLLMSSIASLVPLLPDSESERVKTLLRKLREHNWGYVREAAEQAVSLLPV